MDRHDRASRRSRPRRPARPGRGLRCGPARLALCVALLAATACASGGVGVVTGPHGTRRIEVVAAENMWGSIAAQLGGAHAEVVSIVSSPNADPHDYEPTASDGRLVAEAALVIENGLGYDPWAARLVDAAQVEGQRSLDVGRVLGLHLGANPHRWYFPSDVSAVARRITAEYEAIDPADSAYFERRRTDFLTTDLGRYHELIAEIRTRYAGTPVGASESIFEGIAEATGLRLLTPGSFLDAVSEGTDPTAAAKTEVDDQIAHHRIDVFVYNRQNSTPDVTRLVHAASGRDIPVTTITETLVPPTATFQAWQVAQLESLEHALATGTGR